MFNIKDYPLTPITELTDKIYEELVIGADFKDLSRLGMVGPVTYIDGGEKVPGIFYKFDENTGKWLMFTTEQLMIRFNAGMDPKPAEGPKVVLVGTAEELASVLTEGGVIDLTGDIDLSAPISVAEGKEVVINLNSHKLLAATEVEDGDSSSDIYAVYVKTGKITIEGQGVVEAKDADYSMAVWATGDSEVVIKGGTFINGGDSCDLIYASGNAKVEIYGGEFKAAGPASGTEPGTKNPYSALNIKDKDRSTASILVYGGTFYGFNPADNVSEGDNTNFLAPGRKVVEREENGIKVYDVVRDI